MFPTLRRMLVLAAGTVASSMSFAPVAFAVEVGDGAAGGPNSSATTPQHAHASGSSLATWQWTLISVGIVIAVALIVTVGMTMHRRSTQAGTLQPQRL